MKTIMAMYTGNEPQIGKLNQPFYFGEVPIVQSPIQTVKQAIELAREPILHDYVIRTSGGFFVTPQFAVGIMPGTSFVIVALNDEVADPLLAGVDGYMVKEIDYDTYQRVLVQASKEADAKACEAGDAVEHGYFRYFGIDIAKLAPTDRIQITAHSQEYADQYDCGLSLELDRYLPALDYERILAAAAMYQDIAKELKIGSYTIVVYLHTTDKAGEPCTVTLYSYAAKKETDESSNQATD
jgi:hypothetical protein